MSFLYRLIREKDKNLSITYLCSCGQRL